MGKEMKVCCYSLITVSVSLHQKPYYHNFITYLPRSWPNDTNTATSTCWYSWAIFSDSIVPISIPSTPAFELLEYLKFKKFKSILHNLTLQAKQQHSSFIGFAFYYKILNGFYLKTKRVISLHADNWAFSASKRPKTTCITWFTHL